MPKLILVGGGGHCNACIDVVEAEGRYEILGILDPQLSKGDKLLGYDVLGDDSLFEEYISEGCHFLITIGQIGTHEIRKRVFNLLKKMNGIVATIISPRSYVSKHAVIGEGCIVMHDALVNAGSTILENCIINTKALIEHDSVVEPHCHVSTAAVVNGGSHISEGTFFGSNAVGKQGVRTAYAEFIKAGRCYKGSDI
jgi:sugar O-acyltransferase (sialic acid O-acetyltransferase NeuD family)